VGFQCKERDRKVALIPGLGADFIASIKFDGFESSLSETWIS